ASYWLKMKGKVPQQVPAHAETINNPRKQRKTTWLRRDSNPEPPLTWRLRGFRVRIPAEPSCFSLRSWIIYCFGVCRYLLLYLSFHLNPFPRLFVYLTL